MFADASMNLREWITSDEKLNEFISPEDRGACENVKVLGQKWNVQNDTISVKRPQIPDENQITTKRNVLKCVASVFDPLGLLSPVLLSGKILIQSTWTKGLDWDDELCDDDKERWASIVSDIIDIDSVQIPRRKIRGRSQTHITLLL